MSKQSWSRRDFIKWGLCTGVIGTGAGVVGVKFLESFFVMGLVIFPDPRLRQIAEPVTTFDSSLITLGSKMISTLKYQAYKGMWTGGSLSKGIAAPQVGLAKRLIACSLYGRVKILINPEVVSATGHYQSEEGCLSFPEHTRRLLDRSRKVVVQYQDLEGKHKEIELKERFAAAVEHEIDHLNGVLYIDKPYA